MKMVNDVVSREFARLQKLEEILGVRLKNLGLYLEALTHRSILGQYSDWPYRDNERLEFLGDAVLSMVISHLLYERYAKDYREGELTKMRAWLVNEDRLAKIARRLGLADLILLGPGEEATGGREKASILAGTFEAIIAAFYLDLGFEKTFYLVKKIFARLIPHAPRGLISDHKTVLQEYTQRHFKQTPTYELLKEVGPEHAKVFYVALKLGGETVATGRGRSKKAAEQDAAQKALKKLEGRHGNYSRKDKR